MTNKGLKDYENYDYLLPYMKEVEKFCLPFLNQHKIDHFWYSRIYPDGYFIDIGMDPSWFSYMLRNKHYNFCNEIRFCPGFWPEKEDKFIKNPKNFLLNLSKEDLNIIIEKYKIFHMFNIIINKKKYLENFAFSSPLENYESVLVYSRHFGVLKAFGISFVERFFYMIKDVELQGKIFSPSLLSSNFPRHVSLSNQNETGTQDWVHENIKYFFLSTSSSKDDIAITPRQKECLDYLALGKSYKEISKILNIDTKTVESHMQRLRDKTGLSSRSALIQAFIESGL